MDFQEFIVKFIVPQAAVQARYSYSLDKVKIGEALPYFAHPKDAGNALIMACVEVAHDVVEEYEQDLKESFYEWKALEQITQPLMDFDKGEFLSAEIEEAEKRVKDKFKWYELAVQAEGYIKRVATS